MPEFRSHSYAAFLFDMDGTLLDSSAIVDRIWRSWAERHGIDSEKLLANVHGVRSEDTIRRATDFYTALGKRTIRLHKEVPGHVANRLQAALWREIVHLISEGVVDVADADTAVCWGPGLRWGVMGPTLLFHLGGGQGGIEHFFDQFTGPMTAWWKVLGNPQITPEVRKTVVAGVLKEAGTRSLDALASQRDEVLLGLLKLRAKE